MNSSNSNKEVTMTELEKDDKINLIHEAQEELRNAMLYDLGRKVYPPELEKAVEDILEEHFTEDTLSESCRGYYYFLDSCNLEQMRKESKKRILALIQDEKDKLLQPRKELKCKYGHKQIHKCSKGHPVYAHDSISGWCCACEGDIAFALNWIKDTPEYQVLIQEEVRKARIDEWERMAREYPTAPYIPDFIWKPRLKELSEGKEYV